MLKNVGELTREGRGERKIKQEKVIKKRCISSLSDSRKSGRDEKQWMTLMKNKDDYYLERSIVSEMT